MSNDPWGAACHRGQLEMTVFSRVRALADGVPTHRLAEFVGVLKPDNLPIVAVSFVSLEAVRVFIAELEPRAVEVQCTTTEQACALAAALEPKAATATRH